MRLPLGNASEISLSPSPLARSFRRLEDLDQVDWPILQSRDFKRDNNNLGKTDRYQAEALVWKHLPVEGILGICCYTDGVRDGLKARADALGLSVSVLNKSEWYF
jgi:hypothetical protein